MKMRKVFAMMLMAVAASAAMVACDDDDDKDDKGLPIDGAYTGVVSVPELGLINGLNGMDLTVEWTVEDRGSLGISVTTDTLPVIEKVLTLTAYDKRKVADSTVYTADLQNLVVPQGTISFDSGIINFHPATGTSYIRLPGKLSPPAENVGAAPTETSLVVTITGSKKP